MAHKSIAKMAALIELADCGLPSARIAALHRLTIARAHMYMTSAVSSMDHLLRQVQVSGATRVHLHYKRAVLPMIHDRLGDVG